MFELTGKYAVAKVFADTVDQEAVAQVIGLCNQPFAQGSRIRMMPDIHAGDGCTVGATMTITDRVAPLLVGSDIGCGMLTVQIRDRSVHLPKLDRLIREQVPAGASLRREPHPLLEQAGLDALYCFDSLDLQRAGRSLGTLGGGNHFIEVDQGSYLYLVIHSGSRLVGQAVARYYAQRGEIPDDVPAGTRPMTILRGGELERYLHDMRIAQHFADLNRQAIADTIMAGLGLHETSRFSTVHNYIDLDNMILRKGAVSAKLDEKLLIPLNMRDGSLICRGKGNEDWNCSAPHGAGRRMSRAEAKEVLDTAEYRRQMEHVYSTTVGISTLDESPMAYKAPAEIEKNIQDTAQVIFHLRPIYNFKAGAAEAVTDAGKEYECNPARFYSRQEPPLPDWESILKEFSTRVLGLPMVLNDIMERMRLYVSGEMDIDRFIKLHSRKVPLIDRRIALGERGEEYEKIYFSEVELARAGMQLCHHYSKLESPSEQGKAAFDHALAQAVQRYVERPARKPNGVLI